MRRTTRIGVLASAALLALTGFTGAAPSAAADDAAYFEVTDITRQEWVIKLTDPAKIQHARDLATGQTQDRPHVVGRIAKTGADYNPRWSYHMRPETTDFFDAAIEVCDATAPYVEEHLDEAGGAFLPGLIWCPWTSRIVKEVPR